MRRTIDIHFHVGVLGDDNAHWGGISAQMRNDLTYKIFLLYARLKPDEVTDARLTQAAVEVIQEAAVDHVVCLALDHVYDEQGTGLPSRSHMWVANEYVLHLRDVVGDKVLFGASVHPFDPNFRHRVDRAVDEGACLMKWLPSAQQFSLAHPKVREAMRYLAMANSDGGPLPLLLHVGPEYAIDTSDQRTRSYDFLSWSFWDRVRNGLRGRGNRWHRPDIIGVHKTFEAALQAGAVIIFAHCGLPYFQPRFFGSMFEHSDFDTVRNYLERSARREFAGHCYADVSACATPFREGYFDLIAELPVETLLFGTDFPTPAFELSADLAENWEDFKAILRGELERIVIPEDNLIDVNLRELQHAFPGHPMFTNANDLLIEPPAQWSTGPAFADLEAVRHMYERVPLG